MTDDNYYDRQYHLSINTPRKAVVVGVGGVGSWVALNLALVGTERIVLLDDDVVEDTNLNRSPFTIYQIGMPKVDAIASLIAERRLGCEVIPLQCRSDGLSEDARTLLSGAMVFDCRDSIEPMQIPGTHDCGIIGGYDGTSVTIHINPKLESVFGVEQEVRYRTIPSFVGAPALIAAIIVNYVCLNGTKVTGERIVTFDLENFADILSNGVNHG